MSLNLLLSREWHGFQIPVGVKGMGLQGYGWGYRVSNPWYPPGVPTTFHSLIRVVPQLHTVSDTTTTVAYWAPTNNASYDCQIVSQLLL